MPINKWEGTSYFFFFSWELKAKRHCRAKMSMSVLHCYESCILVHDTNVYYAWEATVRTPGRPRATIPVVFCRRWPDETLVQSRMAGAVWHLDLQTSNSSSGSQAQGVRGHMSIAPVAAWCVPAACWDQKMADRDDMPLQSPECFPVL